MKKLRKISLLSASFLGIAGATVIPLTSCSNKTDETTADIKFELINNDSAYKVAGIKNADKTKIKTITIPITYNNKPVLEIDKGALTGCNAVTTLNIPFIGHSYSTSDFKEGMIGWVFGTEMYEGCGGYTWQECYDTDNETLIYGQYAIPSTLTTVNVTAAKSIPAGAFSMCKNIKTVNITSHTDEKPTSIGNKAFYYCSSLYDFDLDFSKNLRTICKEAFSMCFTLEYIVIPNYVTTIEEGAFANCISSAKTVIPKNPEYPTQTISIGKNAFSNHIGGLILVEYSENEFAKIANSEWTETSIVTVYDYTSGTAIKYVDDWLILIAGSGESKYGYLSQWMGQYNQKSVTIPGKVTVDGKEIPIKVVGGQLFNDNIYTTKLVIEEGIEYIYPNAFYGCTALKYVNFPESLKEIKADAFHGCSSLIGYYDETHEIEVDEIDFKNVTTIGKRAFYGCSSITTLNLKQVTTIGDEGFAHCTHLNGTLTLPDSCTSIGEGAFKYCFKYAPSDYTSSIYYPTVVISNKTTNIPESCFESCGVRNQTSTDLEDKGTYYPKRVRVNIDLNDAKLERIEDAAFKNCWMYQLTGARYTELKYIGDYAFYYAQPISDLEGQKTDLQIDATVEYIGQYAFAYCTTIESLTFLAEKNSKTNEYKNNLKHLGQFAFYYINNSKFTELDMSPCLDLETSYTKSQADITKSSRYAFAACYYLEKVYLPGTDVYRTGTAKMNYQTLVNDELTPYATNFKEISERMFEGDTNIGKDGDRSALIIPKYTTTLRAYAFNGCTFLTKVLIKSKVDFYGTCLFRDCQYLEYVAQEYTDETTYTAVEFSNSITRGRIGSTIYQNCYKLKVAPIAVGKLEGEEETHSTDTYFDLNSSYFINCANLTSIDIPASIRGIGSYCFQGCLSLEKVKLTPSTDIKQRLTYIDPFGFANCIGLQMFNMRDVANPYGTSYFTINNSAFYYCTSLGLNSKAGDTDYWFWLPKCKISMGSKPFEGWDGSLQSIYFSLSNVDNGKGTSWSEPDNFTLFGTSWKLTKHTDAETNEIYYTVVDQLDGSGTNPIRYKYYDRGEEQ